MQNLNSEGNRMQERIARKFHLLQQAYAQIDDFKLLNADAMAPKETAGTDLQNRRSAMSAADASGVGFKWPRHEKPARDSRREWDGERQEAAPGALTKSCPGSNQTSTMMTRVYCFC